MTKSSDARARWKAVAAILMLFAGPLVLGALIGPWVYKGLAMLAGQVSGWEGLKEHLDFRRVTSRCVMIVALILLVPVVRWAGMGRLQALGLRGGAAGAVRGLLVGWLLGCASMAAPYLAGLALGAYGCGEVAQALAREVPALLGYLAGALVIGTIEETFFRGFLFGILRRALRFWPAALWASVLFASVHLLRPVAPPELQGRDWLDGFRLAPHLLAGVERVHLVPSLLTLFLMGLILCRLYERAGTLWLIMGLHAGWVWVMRSAARLLERHEACRPWLFGETDQVARTWAGVLLAMLVLAIVLVLGRRRPSPT